MQRANAQLMIEVLGEPEAYEMLASLLDGWNKEQKVAVRSHLSPEQLEAVRVIFEVSGNLHQSPRHTEAPKLPIETQNVKGK
jgi:hypothetical protein